MPFFHSTVLPVVTLALAATAPAQSWVLRSPAHAPPAQAFQPSMAYHAGTQRVVLYGGRTTAVLADTWTWDGTDWRQESPLRNPGPRWGHRLVAHERLGLVLLFGGQDARGIDQNDTWIWNGSNWGPIVTQHAPPPRSWHQMAYDSRRDRVVVFGGGLVSDALTWEFDGVDWAPVTTAHTPPVVGNGEMVYDASRGVCVLFGGFDSRAGGYAGTWEYDGMDWRSVSTPNRPPPRARHQMSFDDVRNHVVLHGGLSTYGPAHDTWTYDGANWRIWIGTGLTPTESVEGGMAYDRARDRHVMFGGRGPSGVTAKTYEYASAAYASFAASGAGCPGSAGVPKLSSVTDSVPRTGGSFAAQVTNVPQATGTIVVILGFSNAAAGATPLPFDLGFLGMPGCRLDTSLNVTFPAAASQGTATWSLAIPSTLASGTFWQQAFVPDANAGNPGRATLSNACRGTISP